MRSDWGRILTMMNSLALLAGLGTLAAGSVSYETIKEIFKVSENVFFKSAEVIINFERDNNIGVAWLEMGGEPLAETYNFNYVRFNSAGDILLDMRNCMIKPAHLEDFGVDWEESIPMLRSINDNDGNTWLIYSYIEDSWRIGWTEVDSIGTVVRKEPSIFSMRAKSRSIIACPDDNLGFHLYLKLCGGGVYYYNPHIGNPKSLPGDIVYATTGIDLSGSRFLLIDPPSVFTRWIGPDSFAYRIIDDKGRVKKEQVLEWEKYVTTQWGDIDLPNIYLAFKQADLIYFVFTIDQSLYLMTFTTDGAIMKPSRCIQGEIQDITHMPQGSTQFMEIHGNTFYYFGFDDANILYYMSDNITEQKAREK